MVIHHKLLTKFILGIFVFLLLTTCYLVVSTPSILAQNPFPGFKVPCDEEKDPEFNSLRPYQASPCGDSTKALFCNNDYIIAEPVSTEWNEGCQKSGNQYICQTPGMTIERYYVIDGEGAEFPILGNTEDVRNSQNSSDNLDDATKVNEYVSWYLQGTVDKAEYGDVDPKTQEGKSKIVNFSGPLKKLLPSVIQDAQRIQSIENATTKVSYMDEELVVDGSTPQDAIVTEELNHNQIVACATKEIVIDKLFGLIPVPRLTSVGHECYPTPNAEATNEYRLESWEGELSLPRTISNAVKERLLKISGVTEGLIGSMLTESWNDRKPPLPWDEKFDGDYKLYLKAYSEWRGKSCMIIPLLPIPLCVDNPLVTNEYADVFRFVPLSNTVDKNAHHLVGGVGVKSDGQTIAELGPGYKVEFEPALFYPHTQEVYDLTNILNETFSPKEAGEASGGISTNDVENNKCEIVDVRTNPGDYLFPSSKSGRDNDLTVTDISIEVKQIACPAGPIDKWLANRAQCDPSCPPNAGARGLSCIKCDGEPSCDAEVYVEIRSAPKIPWAKEIAENTVTGPESTFRRLFPKTGEGSPVSCIADIPGTSTITYKATSPNTNLIRVDNPQGGQSPESVNLFFPKLGTVYEYFLKGIQTALRPQGYGDPIVNGSQCANLKCGELPETLPKAAGSCSLGGVSSKVGNIPQSFKDIIEAASETYKVPPNLILGVMFGEGVWEARRGYNFTDENVKNWATCEPLPGCSDPETSIVPFLSGPWSNLSTAILPELQKIDPNKTEADACNLLDATYALAKDLSQNQFGSSAFAGKTCFGIGLNSGTSSTSGCSWQDSDIETAIRVWEFGTAYDGQATCATLPGSCEAGGGFDARCPVGDSCEKVTTTRNSSHNACVWDVAHGN